MARCGYLKRQRWAVHYHYSNIRISADRPIYKHACLRLQYVCVLFLPGSSPAPRSKCETNLAKIYKCTSWSWTAEQLPPLSDWPQATSDPSGKIAANAPSVAWICCMFWSWSWTVEQSPPWSGLPQQPLIHQPISLQMQCMWPEYAAHSWADLELRSSHHHHLDCPKQPLIHRPKSLQMHLLWPEFSERSWADLELRSSHHHKLRCPKQSLIHRSKSQQMQCMLPEYMPHVSELILTCGAVTTIMVAPFHLSPLTRSRLNQELVVNNACCEQAGSVQVGLDTLCTYPLNFEILPR